MAGSLFVVATPIGNLEDLTFRALRTLKEVDVIAAEDTRRTSKLLAHYGVAKALVSLHEHNEHREAPRLVARMASGESIALVSDAGTPAISDPGATLVRLSHEAGLKVVPIPGPSAVTAALSVSGLPATPFTFLGFPPASGQARERWLEALHERREVLVFFEAPHRIEKTISDVYSVLAERQIIVKREISKINEEFVIWDKQPVLKKVRSIGEFVVVIGPSQTPEKQIEINVSEALATFDKLVHAAMLDENQATIALSALTGLSRQKLSNVLKKARILVKRQIEAAP